MDKPRELNGFLVCLIVCQKFGGLLFGVGFWFFFSVLLTRTTLKALSRLARILNKRPVLISLVTYECQVGPDYLDLRPSSTTN